MPAPGLKTLEVGCGEGRVCRDLTSRGHRVTGVDASPTLIKLAYDADKDSSYLRAEAAALPFQDKTFDVVVFYNSLMDIDDMQGSLREASRVLQAGGKLCACITHPIADAGSFESRAGDAPFVIKGSYLGGRRPFEIEIERDGLRMHFKGWASPLEDYFAAMQAAGFAVETLREPAEPSMKDASENRWRRIPIFLMWRAVKLGTASP
ncbi:MAG TPA: class I SAM-dependent methyltransferase [Candidatus Dormibacteraeota bacterium]